MKHPSVKPTAFIGNGHGGGADKHRFKQLVGPVGLASICRAENDSPVINMPQDSFIAFVSKRMKKYSRECQRNVMKIGVRWQREDSRTHRDTGAWIYLPVRV